MPPPRASRQESSRSFDYDRIPPGYFDEVYHRNKGVQSKWHHLKFRQFAKAIQPGEKLLDVGCGPGTLCGLLPPETDCAGVDIARPQIDYARRRYGGSGRAFTALADDSLPFEDASFDVATSVEVIEHLPLAKIKKMLGEIRRVLKPGGRILLSTPNYGSLWPLLEWLLNRLSPFSYEEQHVTHFNRRRLEKLLRECGFEDVRIRAFLLFAPFAAALSWKMADAAAALEPEWLTSRAGWLLFAQGVKPA